MTKSESRKLDTQIDKDWLAEFPELGRFYAKIGAFLAFF